MSPSNCQKIKGIREKKLHKERKRKRRKGKSEEEDGDKH